MYAIPLFDGHQKTVGINGQDVGRCSKLQRSGVGGFTGEVSAPMLQSIGIPFVIIGHSERRQYFGEDGKLLAKKVERALRCGLTSDLHVAESRWKYARRGLTRRLVKQNK